MQPDLMPGTNHSRRFAGVRTFHRNDVAAANLSSIGAAAIGVAAVIVGAVVALILMANLSDDYAGAVKNISDNVSTADWGDTTANGIAPTFGMLLSLGGLFALVGLAFVAYRISKKD